MTVHRSCNLLRCIKLNTAWTGKWHCDWQISPDFSSKLNQPPVALRNQFRHLASRGGIRAKTRQMCSDAVDDHQIIEQIYCPRKPPFVSTKTRSVLLQLLPSNPGSRWRWRKT